MDEENEKPGMRVGDRVTIELEGKTYSGFVREPGYQAWQRARNEEMSALAEKLSMPNPQRPAQQGG